MRKELIGAFVLYLIQTLCCSHLHAQDGNKKALGFEAYDLWKQFKTKAISDYSGTVFYEQYSETSDPVLHIVRSAAHRDTFSRAHSTALSFHDSMAVYLVSPGRDTIRTLKLKKTKDEKLPKDSLAIFLLYNDSLILVPRVKSFKLPSDSSNFLSYQLEKPLPEKKKKVEEKKKSKKKKSNKKEEVKKKAEIKENGTTVIISHPPSGFIMDMGKADEYGCSKYGDLFAVVRNWKTDSIDSTSVFAYDTERKERYELLMSRGSSKNIAFDERGEQCVFVHSKDSSEKNKVYSLYYWKREAGQAMLLIDSTSNGMPAGYCVSEHGRLFFSEDGSRLFLGINEIPEKEMKDTLLPEEKVRLDIWSWKDDKLQSQQLTELSKEQKRTYTAVFHFLDRRFVQLADESMETLVLADDKNSDFALGLNSKPYEKQASWEYPGARDLYSVNLQSGSRTLIEKAVSNRYSYSPFGNYLIWYSSIDNSWRSYSTIRNTTVKISGAANVKFDNELHNTPNDAYAYGVAGWLENDKYVFIYDRFDVWKMDPEGKDAPLCLTAGREDKTRYRVVDTDKEKKYWTTQVQLVKVFNEKSKESGFATLDISGPGVVQNYFMEDVYLYDLMRSKHTGKLLWSKGNFNTYPDLLLSEAGFKNTKRVSDLNPQQLNYKWGSVELMSWKAAANKELEGLLFKPEDYDANKSYPMIVYFYERYSQLLNFYFAPRPSPSTISFPFYVSNDYVVFVPDIEYGTGKPGNDALTAVLSGTRAVLKSYPNIDSTRLGLQGQSWGGYQIAYIVTKTDLFAAAMAGAPVSNMTSAYGGIRWASGRSRMFQYEKTQSRIGAPLWERTDLYIENSPLFYAPAVKTPLLIMHNDNDGAVPWYQGIEYFLALRRLEKPVWLLNYNKEEHNLKKWPNKVDLSKRMKQFFDHYLMNAPAPEWMEYGIPAIDKGKNYGFELVD